MVNYLITTTNYFVEKKEGKNWLRGYLSWNRTRDLPVTGSIPGQVPGHGFDSRTSTHEAILAYFKTKC